MDRSQTPRSTTPSDLERMRALVRRRIGTAPYLFGPPNADGDYPSLTVREAPNFLERAALSKSQMESKLARLRGYDDDTAPQLTPEALQRDKRLGFDLCMQDLPLYEALIGIPYPHLPSKFKMRPSRDGTVPNPVQQLKVATGVFPFIATGVREPGHMCGDGGIMERSILVLAWRFAESGDAEILAALKQLDCSVDQLEIFYRGVP